MDGESGDTSSSALDVIESHLDRLMLALRCPACGDPFGTEPYKSASCGHTLCYKCGELVLSTLGRCPVKQPLCDLHIIPKDLKLDRQVRDLVNTANKLHAELHRETGPPATAVTTATVAAPIAATPAAAIGDTSTPRRKRVCVTSVDDRKSKQRIFKSLRGLDADIRTITITMGDEEAISLPDVVVTPLHSSTREFISRSRSIHYALAYKLPIVDVSWVNASYVRRKWLPTRPYECPRPAGPRAHIFDCCVFHIDINDDLLAGDVRRWVGTGGASFEFNVKPRMYVRVVSDLAIDDTDDDDTWSEHIVEQCNKYNIVPQVQDVPWISDCLISQACPPAACILETMAETYTVHDSEWMEDDDVE